MKLLFVGFTFLFINSTVCFSQFQLAIRGTVSDVALSIIQTTDGGISWLSLNIPDPFGNFTNMNIFNVDTEWLVEPGISGGVFFTSNGGTSWARQYTGSTSHIYMYNARFGFMDAGGLQRTTNGGNIWNY